MTLKSDIFMKKSLLGVDFGEKVIGLALYKWGVDPYPMPFERIINLGEKHVLTEFSRVISDECIDFIIIGAPYLLDGKSTSTTVKAQNFLKLIQENFPQIPCIEQDETLTTFEAKDRMLNSARYNFKIDMKQIDTLSASIILEDFIKKVQDES